MHEIQSYMGVARGQLDLIENTFQLIADQIVTMQSPQGALRAARRAPRGRRGDQAVGPRHGGDPRDLRPLEPVSASPVTKEPRWPTPASSRPGPRTSAAATCATRRSSSSSTETSTTSSSSTAALKPLTEFLTEVFWKDVRDTIAVYNLATGVRFVKKAKEAEAQAELMREAPREKALAGLERLLVTSRKVGVVIEYAETIAPSGDASFQGDLDRASIVTLHRWSFLPQIEKQDNVVLLVAENLAELSPKLVSNPKVAVVDVPMPDRDTRRAAARIVDPRLSEKEAERYADLTAGLKLLQIEAILAPPPPAEEDRAEREAFIAGLLGTAGDAAERAKKLSQLTSGLSRDEIRAAPRPRRRRPGRRGRGRRGGPGAQGGRPPHLAEEARDPRAGVLRPRRVRRAAARLLRRRRDGGGQEGPPRPRRQHPRGTDEPRPDGDALHRPDGDRARRSSPRPSRRSAASRRSS